MRALLLFILTLPALPADPQWVRIKSPNFELLTTESPRLGRDAVNHFETVRAFFLQALQLEAPPLPSRIIAFRSKKDYLQYAPYDWTTAYYHGGAERDTIVMSSLASEHYPVAIHEYVHLLMRHSGAKKAPVWLHEGLAELFSTLKPREGKALVGDLIAGRLQQLQNQKWLPMETLTGSTQQQAYANERNKVSIFYSQSWALTHMLNLDKPYGLAFPKFFNLIVNGNDPAATFQAVYGKSLPQVEADLKKYINRSSFTAVLFPVKLDRKTEDLATDTPSPFDTELALIELLTSKEKEAEATTRLTKLAAANPDRAEAHAPLAYLAWIRGDQDTMKSHLDSAYAKSTLSPRMLRLYASTLHGDDSRAKRWEVLTKLLAEEPHDTALRLNYIGDLLHGKEYGKAMEQLKQIKRITSDQAAFFYRATALATHELGDLNQARTAAAKFKERAATDEERAQADRLIQYVSKSKQEWAKLQQTPTPAPALGQYSEEEDNPSPVVRRRASGENQVETVKRNTTQTVKGKLTHMDCLANKLRLTLETPERRILLLIEDPQNIVLKGVSEGRQLELGCGPQKGAPLQIEFEPTPNGPHTTEGAVRSIELLNP
ncbi:MAG: hypothetical protein U0R19_14450 [Bryobacteraceae bacterium]